MCLGRSLTDFSSWLNVFLLAAVCLGVSCDDADPIEPEADMSFDLSKPDLDLGTDAPADIWTHPYADSLFLSDTFLNIAHRGGGLLAPEETMVAYENAVAIGANVIECDVHTTSDGVVICMHDATVSRTTDGTGTVRGMTFEELRGLDAGFAFTTDGGATFPYRGQGVQVATLDEVLEAFPDMYVAIEIKQTQPSMVDSFLAVVDEHDAAHRIVVASFADATIQSLREKRPDILTALALGEMLALQRVKDESEADYVAPALIVQPPYGELTPEFVARMKRVGLRVQVWTVNDPQEMARMIEYGVDGIFTDDPVALQELLKD